jgi:Domain of unknown function (DUF4386)
MTDSTRSASLATLSFGVLMFVPLIVLGSAINWPASLDEPARVVMPLILEQQQSVRFGYLAYLAYSILFFPTITLVGNVLGDTSTMRLASSFAAISSLARSIGILRWLTVLPAIAALHATTNEPAQRMNFETLFTAINSFGGGIGELLGVSVFGALAIALVARAILESKRLPNWLGVFGFVAATGLLLPWLEVFGVNLGPIISLSVALVQVWFLALGIALWRSKPTLVQTRSAL